MNLLLTLSFQLALENPMLIEPADIGSGSHDIGQRTMKYSLNL